MSANCTKDFAITIGDESLVAYWKFDEAAGNNRADSTVNSNGISGLIGSLVAVAGIISNAVRLPATNVDPAGPAMGTLSFMPLWNNTDVTIAGWLRQTSSFPPLVNNETLFTFNVNANGRWAIALESINNNEFQLFYRDALGNTDTLDSGFTIVSGTWFFIVISIDFSASTMGISVDNAAMVTKSISNLVGPSLFPSFGGRNQSTVTQRDYDEFGIWYRKLTTAEISFLYNGGVGRTYPDVPSA